MAETIWTDPESRSEAEHTDSLLKKMSLGVPLHQLWEDAGYTQTQIERFGELLADEAAMAVPATRLEESRRTVRDTVGDSVDTALDV